MNVQDLMLTHPAFCTPETNLVEVAKSQPNYAEARR